MRIRLAYDALGMIRLALCARSDVSYSAVHRFAADKHDLAPESASKQATVLGLELQARHIARR